MAKTVNDYLMEGGVRGVLFKDDLENMLYTITEIKSEFNKEYADPDDFSTQIFMAYEDKDNDGFSPLAPYQENLEASPEEKERFMKRRTDLVCLFIQTLQI